LKDDFERPIDEHLIGLVNYLKEYLNVLNSAKESSKLDEAAKTELIKHLASLLRKQEILKGDIDALNEAIKNSVLLQPLKEQFQKQIDTLSKRQETLKSDIENAINKSV
jgi:RNase adaptor protein for sRNA GlmZ degradation